jgi:hypothetical protein
VRADLTAASGLRSGLFARLFLPAVGGGARLLVPEGARVRRGGLDGVFVVAEGRAQLRWVAIGESTGEHTRNPGLAAEAEHVGRRGAAPLVPTALQHALDPPQRPLLADLRELGHRRPAPRVVVR